MRCTYEPHIYVRKHVAMATVSCTLIFYIVTHIKHSLVLWIGWLVGSLAVCVCVCLYVCPGERGIVKSTWDFPSPEILAGAETSLLVNISISLTVHSVRKA